MLRLIDLAALILLGIVVFQDFKLRQVSWILLPLLFLIFSVKAVLLMQLKDAAVAILFNLCFILFQLLFLTLWMSFRTKKWTNIIDVYLGLGDILFFAAISSAFAPFQFVLFYVVSIVITLTGFIIYRLTSKKVNPEIPLAGAMAAVLIVCMLVAMVVPELNFYNDPLFIAITN